MPRIGIKTTITLTAGGSFKVIMCNVGIRGDSLNQSTNPELRNSAFQPAV